MAKEKKHTLLKIAGTTAVVGGASYVGLGYYIFRNLFDLQNSKIYSGIASDSNDENEKYDWFEHSTREDDFIDSYDGLKLHGIRIMNNGGSHKWLIVVPGFNGSILTMLDILWEADHRGFNILALDNRGSGMSEGSYTGLGWNEHYDVISWVNYLLSKDEKAEIALYGINLGGTTILNTLGEYIPDNVKCAIEDGGFSEAQDFVLHNIKRYLKVDGNLLLPAINLFVKNLLHYSLSEVSTKRQVSLSNTPTLFIHGMEDEFIPASMVFDNYYACNADKELFTIQDTKGNETKLNENYYNTIFEFINKYM